MSINQKQYFDYLVDSSFQGVNRLVVLSFENNVVRTGHTRYFLPAVEIKDYNVMINGKNFLNQPIKTDLITYYNLWKNGN